MNRTINILWLYDDLLDLYGDRGNINAITYQLDYNQIPYTITHKSIYDSLEFNNYDLVYCGPGKDKSVLRACNHLTNYKQQIIEAVNNDKVFLICGNSVMMFGNTITDEENNKYQGLNVFDYDCQITGKVFINDFIAKFDKDDTLSYCFINRTSKLINNDKANLFEVVYSQNDIGKYEGNKLNNLYCTYSLGPLLAKNPHILKSILTQVIGNDDFKMDDKLMNKAYQLTIDEFKMKLN